MIVVDFQMKGHKRYQYYKRQLLVHGFTGQRFCKICKYSMFDCEYLWFVRLFVGRRGDVLSLIFLIDLVTPFSFACIPWCSVCRSMWHIICIHMLHCFPMCLVVDWHIDMFCYSKPSNIDLDSVSILIQIHFLHCTQPFYWDRAFSQAICRRCTSPCRVFAEFAGHLSCLLRRISAPKAWGSSTHSKQKRTKKKSWWSLCTDLSQYWWLRHAHIYIYIQYIDVYILYMYIVYVYIHLFGYICRILP